ncbi:MAG TPA: trypsin-like peptidase domain-containing protein [Longimicrobium sp.]|nr:trypsin-like peptidase domain-containing protein [Longimicrobium sp.]
MNRTLRKLAVPGLLVFGAAGGLTLADAARDPIPDLGAQQTGQGAPGTASAENLAGAFRVASRAAMPAVVHVRVEMGARPVNQQPIPPELRGTPWEEMFRGRQGPRTGSGSGFIISPDGYVLTNNHVVEGATRVTVVLPDKREFEARVVGRDPNTDVAVLKLDARNLPTVRLGDADGLQVGDWVLALGYPLDLGQTTTAGIVSAKGRNLGIMRGTSADAPLEHFIQTDAAINPGNSGGPLVDLQGRVIGINSAIASTTGYYAGYGFAVPINLARRVADDLMRDGRVHRPMIGVEIRDATTADAEVFGLSSPDGAVVAAEPTGPAKAAGIALGDVIVGVDGTAVRGSGDLMETVARKRPGDRVTLDVVRYGDRRRVAVRLDEFQGGRQAAAAEESGAPAGVEERIGFRAIPVTQDIARELRLDRAEGLVVSEVLPGGPAVGALRLGSVIERFNGREVRTVQALRAAAEAVRPGQVVSLVVRRDDGRQAIVNYRVRE